MDLKPTKIASQCSLMQNEKKMSRNIGEYSSTIYTKCLQSFKKKNHKMCLGYQKCTSEYKVYQDEKTRQQQSGNQEGQ